MKPPSGFVDFNKQLLGGEIGALAGTPFFPLAVARFTREPALPSFAAVVGSLLRVGWAPQSIVGHRSSAHAVPLRPSATGV